MVGVVVAALVSLPSTALAQDVVTSTAAEANETVRMVKVSLMAIAVGLMILTILFWIHTDPKRRANAFARKRDRKLEFDDKHQSFLESEKTKEDTGPRYAALPVVEPSELEVDEHEVHQVEADERNDAQAVEADEAAHDDAEPVEAEQEAVEPALAFDDEAEPGGAESPNERDDDAFEPLFSDEFLVDEAETQLVEPVANGVGDFASADSGIAGLSEEVITSPAREAG